MIAVVLRIAVTATVGLFLFDLAAPVPPMPKARRCAAEAFKAATEGAPR